MTAQPDALRRFEELLTALQAASGAYCTAVIIGKGEVNKERVLNEAKESLRSFVAELAKDSQRLKHLAKIAKIESGNCDRYSASTYHITLPSGSDYYTGGEDKPLNEAIDAAIQNEKPSV